MSEKPTYEELEKRIQELEKVEPERINAKEKSKPSNDRLNQIIDFLPDATFMIDISGRVVAWNHAIVEMTKVSAKDMIGRGNYEYAIPFYKQRRPVLIDLALKWKMGYEDKYLSVRRLDGGVLFAEGYNPNLNNGTYLAGSARVLIDSEGHPMGAIESLRDISEVKKTQAELLTARKKAEEALSKVKLLSGLIPICASCKKIRDDKGFWNQIEIYIDQHSEATFSHGICPECIKKEYPELAEEILNETNHKKNLTLK